MSTLDETVGMVEIDPSGIIRLADYFQPRDYVELDAGDRDLGSSGACVLDSSPFNGTGVNRIALAAGKTGRLFVLNADNLGGFRQGAGGTDAVIQSIEVGGSVFGGAGSYPYDGGYFYVAPVGGNLQAFKLGHNSNGAPVFSLAGKSAYVCAGRVGVGQVTVTTDKGKPGTGIVRT
jgi:iron transport multicopper oxidase